MSDASSAVDNEQPMALSNLKDGVYTTNTVKIPVVDLNRSHSFVARTETLDEESDLIIEGRIDPVTRKAFSPGDRVITLSTDEDKRLSATLTLNSLDFLHPDITFTKIEEGVTEDKLEK